MRHAVFTEDGLDIIEDTAQAAKAHTEELKAMGMRMVKIAAHEDETFFDLLGEYLQMGRSWATALKWAKAEYC